MPGRRLARTTPLSAGKPGAAEDGRSGEPAGMRGRSQSLARLAEFTCPAEIRAMPFLAPVHRPHVPFAHAGSGMQVNSAWAAGQRRHAPSFEKAAHTATSGCATHRQGDCRGSGAGRNPCPPSKSSAERAAHPQPPLLDSFRHEGTEPQQLFPDDAHRVGLTGTQLS